MEEPEMNRMLKGRTTMLAGDLRLELPWISYDLLHDYVFSVKAVVRLEFIFCSVNTTPNKGWYKYSHYIKDIFVYEKWTKLQSLHITYYIRVSLFMKKCFKAIRASKTQNSTKNFATCFSHALACACALLFVRVFVYAREWLCLSPSRLRDQEHICASKLTPKREAPLSLFARMRMLNAASFLRAQKRMQTHWFRVTWSYVLMNGESVCIECLDMKRREKLW